MTRNEAIVEYQRLLVSEWEEEDQQKTVDLLCSLTKQGHVRLDSRDVNVIIPLIRPSNDPFIFDVQSMLVYQLMHGLWADLACEGEEEEWEKLGAALYKYIMDVPDEAERSSKLSSYYEGSGDKGTALRYAERSLECTPKDEVVYATRAQAVYFMLWDYGHGDQIEKFLKSLPPEVRAELEYDVGTEETCATES